MVKFNPEALRAWIEAKQVETIGGHAQKKQPPTRQEGKPQNKRGPHAADSEPAARPARESPKDRPKEEKQGGVRKAMEYRARMQIKEKERRLQRARQKEAEDAVGKPDEYV